MNYCTIFDSAYLTRGLLCYQSLRSVEPDSHLYIFCLDETSARVLTEERLANCTVVTLNDFECAELLSIKSMRTRGEYAWTAKPFAIKYVFSKFLVDECSYVDADLYFYAPPKRLSENLVQSSAVLTPHNFARRHDTSASNGVYCGQFIKFRNDRLGNELLNWWKEQCLRWCYNRHEEGRFGDQKYLEHLALQTSVAVADSAVMAAPWNIARYEFRSEDGEIWALDRETLQSQNVVFFHFHGFKLLYEGSLDLGGYRVSKSALTHFYFNYAKELKETNKRLALHYGVASIDAQRLQMGPIDMLRAVRNWLIGRYRIKWG